MAENENIYLRCRKEAAKYNERLRSREGAAELLGISVSSLANYELGVTKVIPPDVVVMMSDLYNAPEMKAAYCKNDCPIGRGDTIATQVNSIELSTVKLMRVLSPGTVEEIKDKLISIAADGYISEDEKPALEELLSFFDSLTLAVGELRLLGEKCLGGRNER